MTCQCVGVGPWPDWPRPRSWPGPRLTWDPSQHRGPLRPNKPRLIRLRPLRQAAPTAPQSAESPQIEELKQLAALKDQGILTEDEFTAKKAQILGL